MAEVTMEARSLLDAVSELFEAVERSVRERPYPALALGLAVGYVAGGGLFSSLTRPLARAALGALLVPGFRDRVRDVADELRGAMGVTGAA